MWAPAPSSSRRWSPGRTLGAVSFIRGEGKPSYGPEDQALAEELASRAALAMDNARLFEQRREAEEESRQSASRLHLLVQVSQLVAEAGLDLEQVVDVLVRAVTRELGDRCLLQLVSEDEQYLELAAVHHPDAMVRELLEEVVRVRRLRVGEGLQGAAVSTGQTLFLGAMSATALEGAGPEAALRPYFVRRGPQDLIAVPLVARGRACGCLLVLRDARGQPYGQDDQVLLESIAGRAALAIEDARLYSAALDSLRLRDDFLSVAGHELKNPLNALQLQLRVLARKAREERLSDSLAERAERVARTGERLGVLIEDLLDVSRITAGQLQLQRSEMDLSTLASEGVSRMAEEFLRAGCEVRVEAQTPVVGLWDRLRLEQVVTNLLSNAIKYGRSKPVPVRVEAAPGLARLFVTDQGYGIAPEEQARIFQRFQRAEATRHIQGLGLGLWICRQIAESHGGTLRVVSEPGKGSTFVLELPHPESGSSSDASLRSRVPTPGGPLFPGLNPVGWRGTAVPGGATNMVFLWTFDESSTCVRALVWTGGSSSGPPQSTPMDDRMNRPTNLSTRMGAPAARLSLLAALVLCTTALAQPAGLPQFEVERLEFNPSGAGSLLVNSGQLLPGGRFRLSLVGHYENKPLTPELIDASEESGFREVTLISHRTTGHLIAAYGLGDKLEVGLQVPLILSQEQGNLEGTGFGAAFGRLQAGHADRQLQPRPAEPVRVHPRGHGGGCERGLPHRQRSGAGP